MQIQVKSVSSGISASNESVVKTSINYKKPRQSVARIQLLKSYWKNRAAS